MTDTHVEMMLPEGKPTYILRYAEPLENIPTQAIGYVSGHPNYSDGYPIYTSSIVDIGDDYIETLNSIYKLEDPINKEGLKVIESD